jgi:hypothetical protein
MIHEIKPIKGNEKECLALIEKFGLKFHQPGERLEEIEDNFDILADATFCVRDRKVLFFSASKTLCQGRWPHILLRFRHGCLSVAPYEKICGFITVFHPMEFVIGQLLPGGGVIPAYRFETRLHLRGLSPLVNWNALGALIALKKRP